MNIPRALNDKFCQKIPVQYAKCIFCDTCLKTRHFTGNVWLVNDFTTQLICIFWKGNIFSKTERKKLQIVLISKFGKFFRF